MFILGIAALLGGGIIALLASRRAPDGFQDQEGFHVGRNPARLAFDVRFKEMAGPLERD